MIARRTGLAATARTPSPISRQIRGGRPARAGSASGARMRARQSAEAANEAASSAIAKGAPIAWTSRPASPGPATPASEALCSNLLFASTICSRPTSAGR